MKLSHILLLSVTALFSFAACDDIDESERFEGPLSIPAGKNVLIEDFTGQKCVNCPIAHKTIEKMHQTYGSERIIAVALHGGPNSVGGKKGLANDESKAYNDRMNIPGWPMGLVDRQGGLQDFEKWANTALKRFFEPLQVEMYAQNVAYDAASRKISFDAQVKGLTSLDGSLQVWLTESGIVAPQDMPSGHPELFPKFPNGGRDREYIHDHVFRATVNGMDGDVLHVDNGQTVTKTYTYTIPDNVTWKAENMSIVVFYYNASGVMQVVDAPVIK